MSSGTVYGPGGFDPNASDHNIIEQYEVPDPEPTSEQLALESALAKLQALGLTVEEAQAIIGS